MKKKLPSPTHAALAEAPGGDVKLPLAEYLTLLRGLGEDPPEASPFSLAITHATYEGVVAGDPADGVFAKLNARIQIEVFKDRWTPIKLFGADVAVQEVTLHQGDGTLVVRGETYVLLARAAGHYDLEATLVCALKGGGSGRGMSLRVPRAACGALTLRIPRGGLEVAVEGALQVETAGDDEHTVVSAALPPSERLQVEWSEAAEAEVEAGPTPAICNGEVVQLVSIGEGVLRARCQIRYELLQGEVGALSLSLPADVVVLGVEGASIRNWTAREEGDTQRLDVALHYPVSDTYSLRVEYQRTMPEASGQASLPLPALAGVERPRGFVGVEARPNVEITVARMEGLARVDIQELPRPLWDMADNPLLFGFKYLRAPCSVAVDVTKHEDVEVLVATIDAAFAEATMVAEGRVETRLTMLVRNNQKQFLRVQLPGDSTVWSTFVSDNPVKPATDREHPGSLLISLEKSQVVQDLHRPFPVEVVYLTEIPELKRVGALSFVCPKVDVPINQLLVKLHVPEEFSYRTFRGSLKKVDAFSRPFYRRPEATRRPASAPVTMASNIAMSQVMDLDAPMETAEEDYELGDALGGERQEAGAFAFDGGVGAVRSSRGLTGGFAMKSRGVLPVRVEVPGQGRTYRFEKLLVIDEHPELQARYWKPWWR